MPKDRNEMLVIYMSRSSPKKNVRPKMSTRHALINNSKYESAELFIILFPKLLKMFSTQSSVCLYMKQIAEGVL